MFHCQRLIIVVDKGTIACAKRINGPFSGKNTINSYGCLRYNPAPEIFLKGGCPFKNIPNTIPIFFRKKNLGLEKCNQIISLSSMTSLKTLHI
jgi:hypothetical protein